MSSEITTILGQNEITAATIRATEILRNSEVPRSAIYTHPGKGGKQFEYIKHTWATKLLQDALGPLWSFNVLEAHIENDGSAWVRSEYIEHIQYCQPDGTIAWHNPTIVEIGAFEGSQAMSAANKLAAAASRSLLRCLMRRYGIGVNLYDSAEEVTPDVAWGQICSMARKASAKFGDGDDDYKLLMGIIRDDLHKAGITKDNLLLRFEEAWRTAFDLTQMYFKHETGSDAISLDEDENEDEGIEENPQPQPQPQQQETSPQSQPQPQPQPSPNGHWAQNAETVAKFYEYMGSMGVDQETVLAALKVKQVSDFTGTKADAVAAVRQYTLEQKASKAFSAGGQRGLNDVRDDEIL